MSWNPARSVTPMSEVVLYFPFISDVGHIWTIVSKKFVAKELERNKEFYSHLTPYWMDLPAPDSNVWTFIDITSVPKSERAVLLLNPDTKHIIVSNTDYANGPYAYKRGFRKWALIPEVFGEKETEDYIQSIQQ